MLIRILRIWLLLNFKITCKFCGQLCYKCLVFLWCRTILYNLYWLNSIETDRGLRIVFPLLHYCLNLILVKDFIITVKLLLAAFDLIPLNTKWITKVNTSFMIGIYRWLGMFFNPIGNFWFLSLTTKADRFSRSFRKLVCLIVIKKSLFVRFCILCLIVPSEIMRL